jgi:predicted alpha/beta-fold hydrolase
LSLRVRIVSIVEKAKLLRRPFYPILWMSNRHLQTVAGSIFADLFWMFRPPVIYQREEVHAHDGSKLFLDWFVNDNLLKDPDSAYGDGLTNFQVGQFFSKTLNRVATQIGNLNATLSGGRINSGPMNGNSDSMDSLRKLNTAGVAQDVYDGEQVVLFYLLYM